MKIASTGTALPVHVYDQTQILAALAGIWAERPELLRRLGGFHEHTQVARRHLALPLERYAEPMTFGQTNDAWIEAAVGLGEHSLRQALDRAELGPRDVDAIFCTSVTGIASPSLDAKLINRMELRPDVKRLPLFGLGCVAGAAGIARAADYVRAYPDQVAVLLSVELCSLTLQREDVSVANLISTGLFGDGAAAVVLTGEKRVADGPKVVATRSVFYPDTEDVMGWKISEKGFQIVLSAGVPEIARTRLAPDVDAFLAAHGLTRRAITRWICHPGGPKVLQAMQTALGLPDAEVELAWRMLREQGNLSSASVLMVLDATLCERTPPPGSYGLVVAMGPGFCSELVLLRW